MQNIPNLEIIEDNPNVKIIKSDYHTLIIENIHEERFPLKDEDNNFIDGIFEIIPAYKKYKLFIGDFMDDTIHNWNQIKHELMNSSYNDILEVHISSYGGYTKEGIEFFNIVNTRFKQSTVYLNYGFSMGANAFLYFDDRVVYENSEIMFHNWSGGFGGKAADIEDQYKHTKKHLNRFFEKTLKPYFSKKEIKKILKGKEKWLDSYEMLERGIANGIIKDGEYYTREQYLEKYKHNGKIKKSFKKKEAENTKKDSGSNQEEHC